MPTYDVYMPVTMSIIIQVEAENEEAAIDEAFEKDWRINITGDAELHECEMHKHVTRGNVCSAVLNSAFAEEV